MVNKKERGFLVFSEVRNSSLTGWSWFSGEAGRSLLRVVLKMLARAVVI